LALFSHRQLPAFGFTGHWLLTTILSSHAPRRNQRGQVVRRPSSTGYCLTPTADLSKTERGPISTNGHSIIQYITEPGDSRGEIKPLFLARRRRTLDHSLVAGAQRQSPQSVPAGWPYGAMPVLCLLSLIFRNSRRVAGKYCHFPAALELDVRVSPHPARAFTNAPCGARSLLSVFSCTWICR